MDIPGIGFNGTSVAVRSWYAREMHYRGHFCIGPVLHALFWEGIVTRRSGVIVRQRLADAEHEWAEEWRTMGSGDNRTARLLDSRLLRQLRLETF